MTIALTAQVVDSQSNQSFEVTYERLPVRIGRNQLNDLRIDRPYVSQFHAAIEVNDGRIWVRDLGSTNGTSHGGRKLVRDQPTDVSASPEVQIGPVIIRFAVREVHAADSVVSQRRASVLDIGTPLGAAIAEERRGHVPPGAEDPFVRQVLPYLEAYRQAWGNVYRVVYEHLTRLQPDVRMRYLRRLLIEQPSVAQEGDFQKVAQYYGVPAHQYGDLSTPMAALAALGALSSELAPDVPPPDDVPKVLAFGRRLRETLEVFLKCFVSLRDGYQEFETEVLRRERSEAGGRIDTARDHRELGAVLFSHDANPEDNAHQLHEVFVDVMTHQVALLNGVMEGAKQLLEKLAPETVERQYEARGKRGGLFSNRYEGLWEEYQRVHADYRGEDKETFLIIFGPQFSRAYAATTGEAYQASGDGSPTGAVRRPMHANQRR
jgi:type VI secretion system protein ImpI